MTTSAPTVIVKMCRRIFSALQNTSADSASPGRFRLSGALAISTARTSSACSRRKARG
jgi:hypothetical protein